MSEETKDPVLEPEPKPAAAKPAKPAVPKPRKWRRRVLRIGAAIILIGLLLRASLHFLLPWAINRAAAQYDLSCTYDRMDLYLLDGDVGLWHLVVAPRGGGTPFLNAEYCRGDISTLQLLRGKVVVQQVVADGAEINVERKADGTIPLLDRLAVSASKGKTTPTASSGKVDLSSPLQIDALRLQHVSAHVRDMAVTPAVDARFDMDLRLSDLGSPSRPARLWMEASSSPLLDVLRIEGQGSSQNQKIEAELHFFLRGLHAKPAAGYLLPLGIQPVAESLSALADVRVKLFSAANPSAFAGEVAIDKILVSADGQAAVAVDRIGVDASSVGRGKMQFGKFSIEGVRMNAERTAGGGFRFAGFELASGQTASGKPVAASPASSASPPLSLDIPLQLNEFSVTGVAISMRDQSIEPATNLRLEVPTFSVKNLDTDSTSSQPATLAGTLLFPGVLRSARLTGSLSPFTANKTARLQFAVDGIRPEAIRPYIEALGVQSNLKDASVAGSMEASVSTGAGGLLSANARLSDVHFRDSGSLLDLDEVSIVGLSVNAGLTQIAIKDFTVVGPSVAASRDANGVLSALGLKVDPRRRKRQVEVPVVAASTPAAPSIPATVLRIPRIDLQHFAWKGVRVQLDDAAVQPPTSLALSDAALELSDLHIDPTSKIASGSPGKIRGSLKAPGLAGNLLVTGTLTPVPSGVSADLEVNGEEIRTAIAAPYLHSFGIEPVLQNGSLHLLAKFDMRSTDQGLQGSGSISNFKLTEAGQELIGVDSAALKGIDLSPQKVAIDSIEVAKPRIGIEREASGTFRAAGLRLLPADQVQPMEAPPVIPVAVAAGTAAPAVPAAAVVAMPVLSLNHLAITDAGLLWTDHAMTPVVQATGSANVNLDHFTFAPNAAPASLKLTARLDGILDELAVGGTVALEPTAAQAKLDVSASGLRQGALLAYLPPGVAVNLKDGRLHTSIDAAISENPKGGATAHLIVRGFDYRDGEAASPLLAFDGARLIASRVDVPGLAVALDEISLDGLETGLVKAPGGEIRCLGISLSQAPLPAAPTTAPATSTPRVHEEAPPIVTVSAVEATTRPALSASQILAGHRKPLPLITLDKLDVNVRKVNVTDLSRPQAAPLLLTDVRFNNRARIKLLGKDPTNGPPVALRLTGAAAPEIAGFLVDIDASPFAPQPALQVDLTAGGINGAGLMALVPELKQQVDGSRLTEGHLHAHLEAQAKIFRRSPIDIDLSHPFDVDFDLKDLEYRDGGAGPMLAGLEEVRSEGIHVEPATKLIQVRSLEITRPSAAAFRDAAGIHAFGLVVKLPTATATPASHTQSAMQPVVIAIAAPAPPPTTQPSAPSEGEIQIARLLVSGLDFRYEDRAVTPIAIVPVTGLDLDVRDLSSRALEQDKPIRFNLLVNSGKVSLPKHQTKGAISGAIADLRAISAGRQVKTAPAMEDRDLFSQLDAAGKVSLYPQPNGWVKSSMSGLELGEFRGIAKTLGIDLDEGTVDYAIDVRMPGDGSMIVRARPVLTDLQVSEPPDGPIFRYLHLPAPLNVGLAAVRDPEGAITIPLDVPIKKGKLAPADVNNAVVGAVGSIVGTAIASAPVKAASAAVDTVSDVVGAFTPLGFLFKKPPPEKPVAISFAAGDATLTGEDLSNIEGAVEKLRKDEKLELTVRHELSAADVERAAVLANPSTDDARRLAGELRVRRGELLQLRAELIGRGRVALASAGPGYEDSTLDQLRAVQRELAGVEDGLDQMYELLRPGADRLAVRRTKQVALQIAQARLDAVEAAVLVSGIPGLEKRLHISHPQFAPSDAAAGGQATLLIVKKK